MVVLVRSIPLFSPVQDTEIDVREYHSIAKLPKDAIFI
jgi:hypothetical protein